MTTTQTYPMAEWIERTVIDNEGDEIGTIDAVYLDDRTGDAAWIAVNTGRLGTRIRFVPLDGATAAGEYLQVPVSKKQVKDAPQADADGQIGPEEEAELYRYYESLYGRDRSQGHDTSGPTTDDAMTRSEEELRVGTTTREKGRVRLRKWVETERVQRKVPVTREEVRIEREPITEGNVGKAMDGPAISEEEHEVTLYEDEVVASKQAVPKERVRLAKDVRMDEETVAENLRKERIEIEGDVRS
ncbi:MAG TPA: PRC and DUF2382 domain-containing protein [Acidimicrobiales bacterium]|nr:PRC and DUF2382 domain-containing protein [Acidimicrobiales bacterium]